MSEDLLTTARANLSHVPKADRSRTAAVVSIAESFAALAGYLAPIAEALDEALAEARAEAESDRP